MNKASNIITIKGQPAAVTFEADINAFRGKFLNVNGYCDFVATSIEALYREGESALDEWMADCEEDGIAPFREEEEQKRLTLRVPHHIDSRLTIVARQHSISKNQLIVDVLEREFSATVEALIGPRAAPYVRLAKLLLQTVNRYFGDVMQMVAA